MSAAPLAVPSDIRYLYDGGFDGFLCCVHASVYGRELPSAILPEKNAGLSLFPTRVIETDAARAEKVRESIPAKISSRALRLIETVFLSCLEEKELKMLRFLLFAYRQGASAMQMLGHEDVAPLLKAQQHLLSERHLLTGFIRFSDYGGGLVATISPKNFILPFLAGHFTARFAKEDFMIYDKAHHAALIYQDRKARIIAVDALELPEPPPEEQRYRAMWKRFYDTIAIESRINPKCRMTHMPKRYWENMLEVRELL